MRKRPTVSELERHYSRFRDARQRIEDEIVHAGVTGPELREARQPEITQLEDALAHLHASLVLVESGWSPKQLATKRHRTPKPLLERRALLNRAYDVLRVATEPMTMAEIMEASVRRPTGLTPKQANDPGLRSALTTLLRGQARVGAVAMTGARPLYWQIIRSPERSSD